MKIFSAPDGLGVEGRGGVFEVAGAYRKGMIARGAQYVTKENEADLIVSHALAKTRREPDVFHCHGVYPTGNRKWSAYYNTLNRVIFRSVLSAKRTIAVSEWSADILRTACHVQPLVIRNGVDFEQIQPGGRQDGWVLWPKLSVNPTCDPAAIKYLAHVKHFKCASIAPISGLQSFGTLTRENFLKLLSECSIYLASTKENCPMAMMEAMAMGIPVVGFDWGYSHEGLENGRGCLLVPPGANALLADAVNTVLNNWDEFSQEARDYAERSFGWEDSFDRLWNVYKLLTDPLTEKKELRWSVVIPHHNYWQYLERAVMSALKQNIPPYEVIIVDDASEYPQKMSRFAKLPGVKILMLDQNVGVAEARNYAIERAEGDLITCLDADDWLEPDYSSRLLPAFQKSVTGIAYGPTQVCNEDETPMPRIWFNKAQEYAHQATGHNGIPTHCMFRREAWLRSGGYLKSYTPAEDANLWLRIMSLGYVASFSHGSPVAGYRTHENSLSASGFPAWHTSREYTKVPAVSGVVYENDAPTMTIVLTNFCGIDELARTIDGLYDITDYGWQVVSDFAMENKRILTAYPFVKWNTRSDTLLSVTLDCGSKLENMHERINMAKEMFL